VHHINGALSAAALLPAISNLIRTLTANTRAVREIIVLARTRLCMQ
jgi:hypothetical protein